MRVVESGAGQVIEAVLRVRYLLLVGVVGVLTFAEAQFRHGDWREFVAASRGLLRGGEGFNVYAMSI